MTETDITATDILKDVDTYSKLLEETEEKSFNNPASKYYGVEINEEVVSEEDFDGSNLEIINSYPLKDYSYRNSEGEWIDLVEVYILLNKITNEYIYYLDEPKLLPERAFGEGKNSLSEVKWYIRIKSDFDTTLSNIDKNRVEARTIEELADTKDDLDILLDKIEDNEFYWYKLQNKIWSFIYDNLLEGVIDEIESAPDKESRMYQTIPEDTKMKIRYFLQRDYIEYGKISPLLNDPYVEEISCNGGGIPLFIYHSEYNENLLSNIAFEIDEAKGINEVENTMKMLANESGEQFNEANAMVDGALPDGSRIQLSSDNVSTMNNFTIRVFDEVPLTPIDLLNYETFSVDQMVWLWLAVENNKSGVIAGGTASGKTTTLNALSTFTSPRSKIVTQEDTLELKIHNDNYIQSVTRESSHSSDVYDIDMMDLVKSSLRQRPDYIFVGEVRGKEANPMFQAMNSGHTAYTTFHANNIGELKNRFINKPINVGPQLLGAFDFVLNQEQLDNGSGRRILKELREVIKMTEDNELKNKLTTSFDYENRTFTDIKWTDSKLIQEIKRENNLTLSELQQEIEDRKELLTYMAENMPRGGEEEIERQKERSKKINRIIKLYMTNKELTMSLMETDLMLHGDLTTAIRLYKGVTDGEKLTKELKNNNINTIYKLIKAETNKNNISSYLEGKDL